MRPFKRWVNTHYHQVMLSLTKFGLSEYAQKPRYGSFNLNNSENTRSCTVMCFHVVLCAFM